MKTLYSLLAQCFCVLMLMGCGGIHPSELDADKRGHSANQEPTKSPKQSSNDEPSQKAKPPVKSQEGANHYEPLKNRAPSQSNQPARTKEVLNIYKQMDQEEGTSIPPAKRSLKNVTSSWSRPSLDPARNRMSPTAWQWWFRRSPSQIKQMRAQGYRVISMQRISGGHFNIVTVRNSGTYKRADEWRGILNATDLHAESFGKNRRIIDLEPFAIGNQIYFAATMVSNTTFAKKTWLWGHDKTLAQIAKILSTQKLRLTDLDAYTVDGQTLYSFVAIRNAGIDAKKWWWYHNVTANVVSAKIKEHKARLLSIHVHPNGRLSVIMVQNDGVRWWWNYGVTQAKVKETIGLTGSRLISLKEFKNQSGKTLYAFVSIDNANEETRRLRGMIHQVFNHSAFGDKAKRGFLVKRVGGPVFAEIGRTVKFQPLSTLKLLPYFYAMWRIEQNLDSFFGTKVSWVEPLVDNIMTPGFNEKVDQSCLKPGAPRTEIKSAPLAYALPTMMWESHNRTFDAVLNLYGTKSINTLVQKLGMKDTVIHLGCPQPNQPTPWAANRSTLADLALLMEGVDQLKFVKNKRTRKEFFQRMINLNYDGAYYISPITGRSTGRLNLNFLRNLIKREAGPKKQGIVNQFMKHVAIRGKGGSGGPSNHETGYSDFLHVTLPFKKGGQITLQTFVVGWFVYGLKKPSVCLQSNSPSNQQACSDLEKEGHSKLNKFSQEIHTIPIRQALQTW